MKKEGKLRRTQSHLFTLLHFFTPVQSFFMVFMQGPNNNEKKKKKKKGMQR